MFKNLKRKSIRKQIEKNLHKRDLTNVNSSLKTLGFLVNEMEFQDFENLYDFADFLGIQRKDVRVFSFVEFQKKAPSLRQNQLNNKDVSWGGVISNQNAQEFLEREFDILIGYYKGSHEFLDLLVSESHAKFKVGATGADQRLFDLIIEIDIDKTTAFKTELKKYLTVLNKLK
ncbi:DUF6913 domain-containing protein [Ulvibacter antarcticus]|uniref:Uncharacterized protein n=1 Tax=Ulvibacter antarcticus TaxID=442714 RepID=A0A3L9YYM8_9FLAO|nr:hypothetical protein [Ulvibacter antarcticus]RMA64907.1 hypothetical protein BXY75_1792 [Ulvibacter antarcticus]